MQIFLKIGFDLLLSDTARIDHITANPLKTLICIITIVMNAKVKCCFVRICLHQIIATKYKQGGGNKFSIKAVLNDESVKREP